MEQINEYIGIITISGFGLMLIFMLFLLAKQNHVSNYFKNAKFIISGIIDFEPTTSENYYTIKIFNHNVNDTRVTSFGFIYRQQNIDYYQKFISESGLPSDYKLMIYSRDFLTHKIAPSALTKIISDMNNGSYKVLKLQIFVTDSLGMTTIYSARNIRKNLHQKLYLAHVERNDALKAQENKLKLELKRQRREVKKEKRAKRRTKLKGLWLRMTKPFRKKSK